MGQSRRHHQEGGGRGLITMQVLQVRQSVPRASSLLQPRERTQASQVASVCEGGRPAHEGGGGGAVLDRKRHWPEA